MVVSRLARAPKMSASRASRSSSSASTMGKYWSTPQSMIACRPERDAALLAIGLGGAQGDEQRVAVALELGPLVGQVRVLDGEVVQAELGLHLLQQPLVRLVEPDPHEAVVVGEDLADVLDLDV